MDHLPPGKVISRRIKVSSTSGAVAHVALYPPAASITGGSFPSAAAHTPDNLSSWTLILPSTAEVPAQGHVTATVTIAVPGDAAPGEEYGVVRCRGPLRSRGRRLRHADQPGRHPAVRVGGAR